MGRLTGIQIHALFAMPPNAKGMCGDINDRKMFLKCLTDPNKCNDLEDTLKKYKTLYPMMKTISELGGIKDEFHLKIAGSYWLGSNQILTRIRKLDTQECLGVFAKNLRQAKVPEEHIKRLISAAPKKEFIPLHLYVLLLSAKAQGEIDLDQINNCAVRSGKVKHLRNDMMAEVDLFYIYKNRSGELVISNRLEEVSYDLITSSIEQNGYVAVHQGAICKSMAKINTITLYNFSQSILDLFNQT